MAGWRDIFSRMGDANGLGAAPLGVPSSGAGTSPGTAGGQNAGQLEPNSRARNMEAGVPYQLVPAYPPFVRIANDPGIVYFPRFRTLVFGGNGVAANTTATQQFQFSVPTIIIARSGGAVEASGAGLPVGRTGLECFSLQMFRAGSQSDLIDAGGGGANNPAVNTLGVNLLGTGGLPALIPGNGLFVDTGSFLNITLTTLLANIQAWITLWAIEEYGPSRG